MTSTCAFSANFQPPERALLIREPYVSLILAHRKRWELRGMATNIRGRIGLIRSGSGLVVGECEITDCLGPLDFDTLKRTPNLSSEEHRELLLDGKVPYLQKDLVNSKTYAWVIEHPLVYFTPLSYKHPSGAIIFVDLTKRGVIECSEVSRSKEQPPKGLLHQLQLF